MVKDYLSTLLAKPNRRHEYLEKIKTSSECYSDSDYKTLVSKASKPEDEIELKSASDYYGNPENKLELRDMFKKSEDYTTINDMKNHFNFGEFQDELASEC